MKSHSLLRFLASTAAAVSTTTAVCSAGTLYWDNYDSETDTAGTSAWDVATNWSTDATGTTNATAAPTSADDLIFSASNLTEAQTINLGAARSARSLTFNSAFTTSILSGTSGGVAYNLNLGAGGITVNSGAGQANIGSGASDGVPVRMTAGQTWTNNSTNALNVKNSIAFADNLGAQTLLVTGSGNTAISAEIRDANSTSGNGATSSILSLTKTGAGTLTLSGSANKYTGLTTVTGGTLSLGKASGITSIAGNVLVNGGTLSWGGNGHQVADTSDIQMTSGNIALNGRTETIRNLSISGGQITTGAAALTTDTISLSPGAASTLMTISSAATITTNSLTLSGTPRALGGTSAGGNLLMGGNSASVVTRLVIGSGGFSMNNQIVQFNRVNPNSLGAVVELGGGFTGTGTNIIGFATSGSGEDTATKATLDLGTDKRNFAINSGTTSIHIPLAGSGGFEKTGAGTLNLAGASTLTGVTEVHGGVMHVTGSLSATTSLSVANATFSYGATDAVNDDAAVTLGSAAILQMNNFSDALGVLSVTGSAELALAGGASIISFADSSSADWTLAALSITGWNGDAAGNGAEQVVFANQGLTTDQLGRIVFVNPEGFTAGIYSAKFINNELVPDALIPEPTSIATFLLGTCGLLLRRTRGGRPS